MTNLQNWWDEFDTLIETCPMNPYRIRSHVRNLWQQCQKEELGETFKELYEERTEDVKRDIKELPQLYEKVRNSYPRVLTERAAVQKALQKAENKIEVLQALNEGLMYEDTTGVDCIKWRKRALQAERVVEGFIIAQQELQQVVNMRVSKCANRTAECATCNDTHWIDDTGIPPGPLGHPKILCPDCSK